MITGGIDAVVLVRDPSGAVLLEQHGDTWPQPAGGEGAGEEQPVEGTGVAAPQVSLGPGTYLVSCHYPDGGEGSTRLRVTP